MIAAVLVSADVDKRFENAEGVVGTSVRESTRQIMYGVSVLVPAELPSSCKLSLDCCLFRVSFSVFVESCLALSVAVKH